MDIEHGYVSIKVLDNIIVVRIKGAFNEFGTKQYTEGVKKIVDGFQGQSFALLLNNLEFLGGTPEAFMELENYNIWLNKQKLIAKAMVITSSTIIDVINMQSPARSSQNIQYFENEKNAMDWLKKLI